jgi:hypothetical protein
MAQRKMNPKNEMITFVIDGFFSTVAVASGTALYNGVSSPLHQAALFGFGGIATLTVLSRRWPWRSSSRMPRWDRAFSTFQSLTPSQGGGWVMGWHDRREPEPEEFVFSGLGLPVPIPESTLYRFINIARQRQQNALHGTRFAMRLTGRNFHQTKINWVLSQSHYTKYLRPRWPRDEYFSCLMILGYTRLMVGRSSGTSGRLFGTVGQWSTDDYCRLAIERWTAHTAASPPAFNLSRLFRKSYN